MLFLFFALNEKHLHIISFDNPFPPNYGGVIDVFYKIKALHQLGIKIYLHCFYLERNQVSDELKAITEKVFLYPKNRNPLFLFSPIPMSVISRFDKKLIENITTIDAPILVEGLQSSMIMNRFDLKNHKVILRLHNIESNFYAGMSHNETSFLKKTLYRLEAFKYKNYQEIINQFQHVFGLSHYECEFLAIQTKNWSYLPVFHGNEINNQLSEFGDFALYHGDLRLADNKKAAAFCISLFKEIKNYKLIIASSNGKDFAMNFIGESQNIEFVELENHKHLESLLSKAHLNILMSFQKSGTKLKIINALHRSRFCLINENMVDDKQILKLCEVATTKEEFIVAVNRLKSKPYLDNEIRQKTLKEVYNDAENATKIAKIIWDS
ncbi:hypothetical protein [Flavobacterium sp.]